MKNIKLNFRLLILVVLMAMVSACATNNIRYNNQGYSTVDVHKSLNDVYSEALRLIESDQAPSLAGESYAINTNQKNEQKALILAVNDNDPNDFIEVVMKRVSQSTTNLAVKYGKQGNSLKSATFISMIQEK
ncbi:DUF3568 family protein [Francisella sp. LA112445]|uniref:DUF3568 family protein n=1 Tax=Francisella sp. LA112445 TaxID=1395624 RepID=UPI001788B72E|nr:DUF3568 family protein [Francisella sp. LA112445]QIW10609.1 DUF3568 family protein [Francisella sp. LA112445]